MSGAAPTNNARALRIRASPPRNNLGHKKVWNGENWLTRTKAMDIARARQSELTKIYNNSAEEYENLYQRIQEYKLMGAPPDELIYINQRLLQLLEKATEDKIAAEEAIETYKNLRNAPITPADQRRNRKTRKSNNRR